MQAARDIAWKKTSIFQSLVPTGPCVLEAGGSGEEDALSRVLEAPLLGEAGLCGSLLTEQSACELERILRAGWSQFLSGKAVALASEMRLAFACITLQ